MVVVNCYLGLGDVQIESELLKKLVLRLGPMRTNWSAVLRRDYSSRFPTPTRSRSRQPRPDLATEPFAWGSIRLRCGQNGLQWRPGRLRQGSGDRPPASHQAAGGPSWEWAIWRSFINCMKP